MKTTPIQFCYRFLAAGFAVTALAVLAAGCAVEVDEGEDLGPSEALEESQVTSTEQAVVAAGWHTVEWCAAVRLQPNPCSQNLQTLCAGRKFYAVNNWQQGTACTPGCCAQAPYFAHGHADDGTIGYIRWDALN